MHRFALWIVLKETLCIVEMLRATINLLLVLPQIQIKQRFGL